MEIGRPSQSKQPSRKGKKAWRKNINIEDINEGLDTVREIERDTGVKDMGVIEADSLFQVDTAGDEMLKTKKERAAKPMKADEILGRRSKVPALEAKSKSARKNKEGLSSRQVQKLLDRAGKSTKSVSNTVEHQGLVKPASYDLWGDDDGAKDEKSFIRDLKPAHSHPATQKAPQTMGQQPLSKATDRQKVEAVAIPDEGKSYNPTIEAWQALLVREHEQEAAREEQRLALEEEQNRIQLIIANYDDNGELSDSEDDEDEDEDEEAAAEDSQDDDPTSLSVNQPVQNKKKLRKQRNREERHLSKQKLQETVRDLKKQIRDLENIPKLLKEAERQIALATAAAAATAAAKSAAPDPTGPAKRKAPKQSRSHAFAQMPLEIKLSDELADSLRLLKPEGDLTTERFRSLQDRGLIEPRVRAVKKRKYTKKVTEKWGYKDMTL